MLDEFYLCFDQLGSRSNVCSAFASGVPPACASTRRALQTSVCARSMQSTRRCRPSTGVSANNAAAKTTFNNVRQSLPGGAGIQAFLSSHQTSIAQLAITLLQRAGRRRGRARQLLPQHSTSVRTSPPADAPRSSIRWSTKADRQRSHRSPMRPQSQTELDASDRPLVLVGGSCASGSQTRRSSKAVCGAALGNAAMLVR